MRPFACTNAQWKEKDMKNYVHGETTPTSKEMETN